MLMKNCAIISACLMGLNCRYNAKNRLCNYLDVYLKKHILIPICPEQLGGLTTPREKAEIENGDGFYVINNKSRVITKTGKDVTKNFIKGAKEVLYFVKKFGIKLAYFQDKSPSCGVNNIYVEGILTKGVGVTTALLIENNIEVLGVDV
jgi:uncharacterized protein YbbK (DUF523 family)